MLGITEQTIFGGHHHVLPLDR